MALALNYILLSWHTACDSETARRATLSPFFSCTSASACRRFCNFPFLPFLHFKYECRLLRINFFLLKCFNFQVNASGSNQRYIAVAPLSALSFAPSRHLAVVFVQQFQFPFCRRQIEINFIYVNSGLNMYASDCCCMCCAVANASARTA